MWFHGTPGARRQIPEEARRIAADRGLRIVGIDRPGVGLSTTHLYEAIYDFVPDLEIVADQLGIDRFATIGLSGGGPYAMAAAAGLPDRVPAVGVLGGVVPSVGPDAPPGGWVGFAKRFRSVLPYMRTSTACSSPPPSGSPGRSAPRRSSSTPASRRPVDRRCCSART